MFTAEPASTALMLAVFGALLALAALLSRTLGRLGVPVVILFLLLGMLAGSDGIGGIYFDDYRLAFRVGTLALALILFDGGLNTSVHVVRRHLAPAAVLATAGVVVTAVLVALIGRAIGFSWQEAMLLGAVVSSTDAAAVFSILRGSGLNLKQRVGGTLELESGLNDPMAVILTLALTGSFVGGGAPSVAAIALQVALQLAVGGVLGLAIGWGGRALVARVRVFAGGLVPVLTLAIACLAFGVPTLLGGSGFLAVYLAGIVLGAGPLPYRAALLRIHDFVAWFAQVVMFIALGLLVFPHELIGVAGSGLIVAAFLMLVARPVAVLACALPFRYRPRELVYMGWVGLRGAVPIILAIFPIFAGVEGGMRIFNVVFFVVVVSAILQGGSVRWLTRRLGLQAKGPPPPPAVLEITSTRILSGDVLSFHVDRSSAVCGATIAEIPFPSGSAAMLVVRGQELIAPRGATRLEPGDHVYAFCRAEDRPLLRLLFAQEPPSDDE